MQYKRNEDSPVSRFEPWLELDLEQLAWNLEEICKYTGSRPVSVELTGNAFGHGLIEIAVALAEMGVVEIVVHGSRERAVLDALELKGVAITRIRIGQPVKRGETVPIGAPLFGLEMFRGNLLKPVYTLKTRVLMIKKIPAGAEIGWNNEKKIAKDTLFAALPIGYYDGYPPDANGKVDVLIHGRRYPVSGFISADHTTVDITGTTDIEIGDEVVLVGKQGCEEITHRELSLVSGRGVVEQAMRLYPRLPRLVKHKKGSGYYRYDYSEPGITADDGEPWIELNKKSLNKNLEIVSRQVKHKPILAVVKCNAYGHGLLEISRALIEKGIRHLAVVKPREALTLRENNIQTMILNLGSFSVLEAAELVKQNISQSVFTHRVALLSEAAVKLRKKAKVHIKLDTGLGRVGVPFEEAASYIRYVAELPGISIEGIFTVLTHFDRVPQQIRQFTLLCEKMKAEGISPGIRHAAASGDVADGPESAYLDMVRPGNCLYGMSTFPGLDLEPVLSLKVRIGRIEKEANRLTAYLPIGLADGYPADKTGKMEVLVKGKRCPVIGTEHSFTTIDITGQPTARPGDTVILVGTDGDERITLEELSRHSGQSAYRTPVYLSPDIPGETIE